MSKPFPATHQLIIWTSEPTRFLFVSARCFISNPKGFPVLPKLAQDFIRGIIHQRPTIILAHIDLHLHPQGGEVAYLQYIRHLEKTSPQIQAAEIEGTLEHFARGYQDYLQAPLQPLMDNLPSITYEMFEKDPVKYAQYEKAIELAVKDKLAVQERVLQERNRKEWNGDIELIFGDMRSIELPEKVDILVSELLGSFGDNELSPECLDGAMRFLGQNGVSIPSSYTAYLTPLSSTKLYSEVHSSLKDDKVAETPYVVLFNAVNILSNDDQGPRKQCGGCIQKCWSFAHPNYNINLDSRGLPFSNNHNSRSVVLNFYVPHVGVLHGLGGYFETVLYGDIGLSIHPRTKDSISPNMLSWFPLFFPLKASFFSRCFYIKLMLRYLGALIRTGKFGTACLIMAPNRY
ncbi:hypothetical protein Clacol_002777 [Clathrus columnatus]|uniref:Protein arginine N-methyltransferase 5 n=1 Tax=Clathrus columnatus TaxID=1419009 RepID=A0AAV5A740_9AGAM|nr:hypothetical protein Clacol_002777 [Clathrus columnatus]